MRKINAILGPVMIVLLLIHIISGAFQLFGIIPGGSQIRMVLSYILAAIICIHMLIGIKLTVDTLLVRKRTGASYFRENERFWIARISGLAMIVLIIYHLLIFTGSSGEAFRLHSFGVLQLAAHILLAAVLFLHLCVNIRPLFIALGIADRKYLKDILVILGIVFLVCAVSFLAYYLQWHVLWKYGA